MPRKLADIDLDKLETLAALQCTQEEAAGFFGVARETLNRKLRQKQYREAWERGRLSGLASLRRAQYESAVKRGNVTAQIWLGKQYLGQRDTPENPGDARSAAEEYLRLQKGE